MPTDKTARVYEKLRSFFARAGALGMRGVALDPTCWIRATRRNGGISRIDFETARIGKTLALMVRDGQPCDLKHYELLHILAEFDVLDKKIAIKLKNRPSYLDVLEPVLERIDLAFECVNIYAQEPRKKEITTKVNEWGWLEIEGK